MFLKEINDLEARFELIEMYLLRYKMNLVLSSMAKSYMTNLKKTKSVFDDFLRRIAGRIGTMASYHARTKKLLFQQNLDLDAEMMTIPDIPSGERTITFSHCFLIFSNIVSEYISYGYYDSVSICTKNTSLPMCTRIQMLLDYSYTLLSSGMRFVQDKATNRLESELNKMATQGEITTYIMISVCTGLVVISLAIIIPVFNLVIQDKSYVLAIFSDISAEDVQKIITSCSKLDIKSIKYKRKWIEKYGDREDNFYRKIVKEHRKGFGVKVECEEVEKELVTPVVLNQKFLKSLKTGVEYTKTQENAQKIGSAGNLIFNNGILEANNKGSTYFNFNLNTKDVVANDNKKEELQESQSQNQNNNENENDKKKNEKKKKNDREESEKKEDVNVKQSNEEKKIEIEKKLKQRREQFTKIE